MGKAFVKSKVGSGVQRAIRLAGWTGVSLPLAVLILSPAGLSGSVLGTAQNFVVLGGSAVSSTGVTSLNGDLGVAPGSAITNGGTLAITGTIHQTDAVAQQAHSDMLTSYNYLAGLPSNTDMTGQDLGGLTLMAGVFHFSSSAQLTGGLTLDAQNDPNALFVFQIGSTLTTASSSFVQVINGGPGVGVFWQVGSSATLGTSTDFAGNILALSSISLNTSAQILCGRALAQNGAVTMDTNLVSDNCVAGGALGSGHTDFGSSGFSGAAQQGVPEPGSFVLLSLGLLGVFVLRRS